MRLVCPNCDAQYEVDDAAIPDAGRDVQCSNCGHAWFQRHPTAEAEQEIEDEIFLSDDEVAPGPHPQPAAPPPVEPAPAVAAAPPAPATDEYDEEPELPAPPPPAEEVQPPKRALDESLMAVLREEAEREQAVRAAEAPPDARPTVEQAAPAVAPAPVAPPPVPPSVLAARERFADLSVDRDVEDEEEVVIRPASRRELLPDIEEINSTLRATSEPRGMEEEPPLPPVVVADSRPGFRSGFLLMLLVAAGLWLAYVMAPRISTQIPASASAMDAYVAVVDKARISVDAALQSASQSLRSLSGQDG